MRACSFRIVCFYNFSLDCINKMCRDDFTFWNFDNEFA